MRCLERADALAIDEAEQLVGTRRYDGTPQGAIGFPVVNTDAILNEYLPDGDHDEEIVDENAATGLRVKVYDDRIRVEVRDFKDGRGPANPEGEAKMIKYQDFAKQHRLSTPPVSSEIAPTPEADWASAEGSSAGAKAALVIGIFAALSGAFGLIASQFGDQLRGLLPAPFLELAQR